MHNYYVTCKTCGANLDPGERCTDCYPMDTHETTSDYKFVKGTNDMKCRYLTSSFVCLDDISGHMEKMNPVVHNPKNEDVQFNRNNIKAVIKNHYNVILTESQLDILTAFDEHENETFVATIREMIKK